MHHRLVRPTHTRPVRLPITLAPLLFLAGLAACSSPSGPSSAIAGVWRTAPIPSGSGIDLSLVAAGDVVTGTGHQYNLQYLADSLSVTGSTQLGGRFQLTLTFGSGQHAAYAGQVVGSDELDGTWTAPGQSYPLIFYRQTP